MPLGELRGLEKIGHGAQSTVYRAMLDGQVITLKIPTAQAGSEGEQAILRMRHEAALLARTSHPGLPTVLGLAEWEGQPCLLLEYVEGVTLDRLLLQGPLPEEQVVTIACTLAGALHELHRHGLVHRDVKPQNVVVAPSGAVRLIDFGLLTAAHQPGDDAAFVGTFLYTAPEQSGMLRRPVDGRADLYALGVLLFEAATGEPPFQADSPAEAARLHLAVPAPSACQRNPRLSPALGAILAKLLAKEPEERYQAGEGLLADLNRLAALNQAIASGQVVPLGRSDHPIEPLDEVACFGRERELDELQVAWRRALQGDGQVVLVEGEPGAGKSRVIREFLRQVDGRAQLAGKCAEGDPTPFAPLREALEDHLHAWRSLTPTERAAQEERLRTAAVGFAPLLRRFSPLAAEVVGPPADEAAAPEGREAFLDGLAGLFARLAQLNKGLVLFLDDLQWVDEATTAVVERVTGRLQGVPLLLLVAVRSNSAGAAIFDRIVAGAEPRTVGRILLDPLADREVERLVSAHLGGGRPDEALLHQTLLHTGGNPFAVGEYIRTMLEAGLIWPQRSGWQVDLAGLESLELPGGVVALLLRRFDSLQPQTVEVLSAASLLGQRFSAAALVRLQLADQAQVHQAVEEAMAARLIARQEGERYAFVHDRVREALHALLPEAIRRSLHQRIAEMMESDPSGGLDRVYALARHYALGEPAKSPERSCLAHLAAGKAAMRDFADEEAYGFLQRAQAIALEFGIPTDGTLEEALGAAAIRTGRLHEAKGHLEAALSHQRLPVNRAAIQAQLARVHLWNLDSPAAWRAVEEGFSALGLRMDRPRLWDLLLALAAGLGGSVARRLGLGRRPVSPAQAERLRVLLHLYEQATEAALFEGHSPLLVLLTMLRSAQYGEELGPSSELAFALTNIGFLLDNLRLPGLSSRRYRRAEAMARALHDRHIAARVLHLEALGYTFKGEVQRSEALHRHYLKEYGPWLRTADALNGTSDLVWSLIMRGHLREGWEWIEAGMRLAEAAGVETGAMRIHWWPYAYAAPTLAALGHPAQGELYLQRVYELLGENRSSWEIYLSQRLLFLLERGEWGEEMDRVIDQFYDRDLHPRRPVPHHQRFYLFQGYARWAQWRTAPESERPARLEQLTRAVRELRRVGRQPILQAHAHLIRAAHAWASGGYRAAERLLVRAEALAHTADSPWVQFEALRLRSHMAQGKGERAQALRYARLAFTLAVELGWAGRARLLRSELDVGQAVAPEPAVSGPGAGSPLRLQRHLDALLQVSLATAESLEPAAKSRAILREIVRILGAERACLFLIMDGAADLQFALGLDAAGQELEELTGHSRTVVERVAMRRQPLVVHEAEEGALLGSASIIQHDLRSIIAAPLLLQDRLIGVVYVDNRLARGIFSREDEQILLALASHIAIAIQSAQLAQLQVEVEGERRQRLLAESLRNLTHALSASLSLQEVVERFMELLPEIIPCRGATVMLLDGERLRPLSAQGAVICEPALPLARFPLLHQVVRTGRPLLIPDLAATAEPLPCGRTQPNGSWIGVPLVSRGEVSGLIAICSEGPRSFGEKELELAYTLAGPTGIAIANARLFEEVRQAAATDELTGIANRRHLMGSGEREWARTRRQQQPLAVLMLDVDHFKRINDRHGHLVGDQVLRAVVARCQRHLREVDLMGRYGGEEFAILLPAANLEQATQVAERLREAVCHEPMETEAGPIPVSISVGVAVADDRMGGLSDLLREGDTALYAAKEAGRNRVVVAACTT